MSSTSAVDICSWPIPKSRMRAGARWKPGGHRAATNCATSVSLKSRRVWECAAPKNSSRRRPVCSCRLVRAEAGYGNGGGAGGGRTTAGSCSPASHPVSRVIATVDDGARRRGTAVSSTMMMSTQPLHVSGCRSNRNRPGAMPTAVLAACLQACSCVLAPKLSCRLPCASPCTSPCMFLCESSTLSCRRPKLTPLPAVSSPLPLPKSSESDAVEPESNTLRCIISRGAVATEELPGRAYRVCRLDSSTPAPATASSSPVTIAMQKSLKASSARGSPCIRLPSVSASCTANSADASSTVGETA